MTTDHDAAPNGEYPDASRRTHFARERTLLAWWRTGIAVNDHADVPSWAVLAITAYLVGLIVLSVIAFF